MRGGKSLTAMNMEESKEKQNPISAEDERNASGRCLPSFSISASESVPGGKHNSGSLVIGTLCSNSIFESLWVGTR
jgi:hypothetical protein